MGLFFIGASCICNMWNGTMFVDLDWPLNASSLLSASAELLVTSSVIVSIQNVLLVQIQAWRPLVSGIASNWVFTRSDRQTDRSVWRSERVNTH